MKFVNRVTLGRLLPAGAVAAVLAVSYLAQAPTLASNNDDGYGNNCGVKGYGYHDHGKPCPNRPFPGQGQGLTIAINNGNGSSETSGSTTNGSSGESGATTTSASEESPVATGGGGNAIASLGNGHGRGHTKGPHAP
jgi:hypothetical protein